MNATRTWSTAELTAALYEHLVTTTGAAVFTEVPTPGVESPERRIDALAVTFHDGGVHLAAYEVKVTRQDFAADVRNPPKQAPWQAIADAHYYVVPGELAINPAAVPVASGLLEAVTENHHLAGPHTVWRATAALAPVPTDRDSEARADVIRGLLRRGANAEGLILGLHGIDAPKSPEELRAEVMRLRAELAASERTAVRERAAHLAWKGLAARQGAKVACSTCGAAVIPTRIVGGELSAWRHAQPDLTQDCPANVTGVHPREDTP